MRPKNKFPPPVVIGLTGGIGSGKSTVSQLLATNHIPTIDTDLIARDVVTPNSAGLNAIVKHFGGTILKTDGTLNRAILRKIVFNNAQAKQQLEAILHPLIQTETQKQIAQLKQNAQKTPLPFILVAIPLLTEIIQKNGHKPNYLDQIWVVDTTVEQQIKQACQRDQNTPEQIQKIIQQQVSRAERLAIADVVIHNTKGIDHLKQQLDTLIAPFLSPEDLAKMPK